jgi:hypothetical protein
MMARFYNRGYGRFLTTDPVRYTDLTNPQGWNAYTYTLNNPLSYVDPLGEAVYLVTFTTGNSEGDDEIRRAAATRASELQASKDFDPERDRVLLRGVGDKQDFSDAVAEANALERQFGKVQEVSLFSHAGTADGPVFHDKGGSTQFTKDEVSRLSVNWASGASARFFGCHTGINFAQEFATAQGVPTYGFERFAYFSSRPDRRSGPDSSGPLWMVDAPGWRNGGLRGLWSHYWSRPAASPMVRRHP